ncbi:MAG: cyclic-phosphate processing receiver domain-containing protein [Muricoprocola sp.]
MREILRKGKELPMKLWLDDVREAPSGYEHVYSVDEAKQMIQSWEEAGEEIELLDLDYDMGVYEECGGNGMDFLEWLLYRETFYPVRVHSYNIIACENMEGLIESYWE